MTTCRELLERLTAEEAASYPVDHGNPGYPGDKGIQVGHELHCDYCGANVDSDDRPHKDDCPWAEACAFLAQPEGAREAALVKALRRFGPLAYEGFSGRQICIYCGAGANRIEDIRHCAHCAQVAGAKVVADTSPAAAALLAQGELIRRQEWLVDELRTHLKMEGHGSFVHNPGCHLCHAFTRTTDDAPQARAAQGEKE